LSRVIKAGEVSVRVDSLPEVRPAHGRATPVRGDRGLRRMIFDTAEILRQAKKEAAVIVERARAEASRLVEEAEARLAQADQAVEKARSQAREEGLVLGREEGFQAGREEGLASARGLVAEVERVLSAAVEARQALLQQAEDDLIKLAIAVAERLLCQEIEEGRAKAGVLLRRLVPDIEGERSAKVRLSPQSLEALGDESDLLASLLREGASVELVADPSLGPMDAVVELDWGIVDARLQSRWRRVIEGLDLAPAQSEGEPL